MLRRAVLLLTATVIAGAAGAGPALAQDPVGCRSNSFQLAISKDRTYIRDGETINYTVSVSNPGLPACTVSSANVQLQLPDATGNPSSVLQTLTQNATFGVPFGPLDFGPFSYTVSLGTAPPPRYTARVSIASAKLHDIPPPYSNLDIDRTLQTLWVQPSVTIAKVGSTTGGPAPQTVTYTYSVHNTTTVPPATPPAVGPGIPLDDPATSIANVAPTDNLCSPLKYASGDTNNDGKLQQSETWVYTCTSYFSNPGTYTNTATVCGDNVIDNIPKHVCSPPANWTVNVTAPPKGAVKAACVSLASTHAKVRARELTTVRVRVRVNGRNIARSKVRITGPAGLKRTGRTNKKGIVTFIVRPKKSGRLTIQSDQCTIKARVSVKPARRVVAPALPEVTG